MIEAAMFGALGRDAEVKTSKTGNAYLRVNLRVGDGDAAQWVNATVFDTKAIDVADKLVKGARVYMEGRIALDEWTAQDGAKRHGLSMLSWHCRLAQIGRNRAKRESDKPARLPEAGSRAGGDPNLNDDIPF